MLRFSETIEIINGNPYVRPPDSVLEEIFWQAHKYTSPIPVRGTINGAAFRQSLVRYEGDWRLYVNIIMAKAGDIDFTRSISEIVGRKAYFEVEYNPVPETYTMLPFLKKALADNPVASINWKQLPPHRRKEILRYFSRLKSDEAKQRNLEKMLYVLSGKEGRFMARAWKDGK